MGVVTWCRGGVGGPGTPVGAPRCWRRAAGHRRHPGPRSPPPASSPLRPASLPARAKWPPTGPSTTMSAGARRACCFPPRQSQGGLLDRGPVEAPRRRGCLPHGGDGEDRCRQTDRGARPGGSTSQDVHGGDAIERSARWPAIAPRPAAPDGPPEGPAPGAGSAAVVVPGAPPAERSWWAAVGRRPSPERGPSLLEARSSTVPSTRLRPWGGVLGPARWPGSRTPRSAGPPARRGGRATSRPIWPGSSGCRG